MQQDQPQQPATDQPATSGAETAGAPEGDAVGGSGAESLSPDEVGKSIAEGLDSVGNSFEQFAQNPTLDNAMQLFGPMLIDLGLSILGLIVLLIVVSFVGRWAQRLSRLGLNRLKLEPTVVQFLSRSAKYAVWIIAIPIALELFGVRTTSIATVIGATGLAIGLAMQGSLSNIAAGLMLLMLRPFKIGDWVELDDEFGIVEDIGIFYTTIQTFSNKAVMLPNSEVLGNKIEHFTVYEHRRVDVPVGVAYGTDLEKAMRVLEEVAKGVSKSDDPQQQPSVLLTGFGDSSIDFEVRVWCDSREFLAARTETVRGINRALHEAGIEIPFPQRTLTFAGGLSVDTGGRRGSDADSETGE